MKRLLIVPILIALVIGSGAQPAVAAKDKVPTTRGARILFLPLFGYQNMNDEQIIVAYHGFYKLVMQNIDSVSAVYDSSEVRERSVRAPMFGLVIRFRPNSLINVDATCAIIQDRFSYVYEALIPILDYSTQVLPMSVTRKNTIFGAIDLGFNVPLKDMKLLGLTLNVGAGYAYRSIEAEDYYLRQSYANIETLFDFKNKNKNADRMLLYRGGVDISFWFRNNLKILWSIFYTQYHPLEKEIDPFGGIGWKICLFPIWSGR